MGDAVFEMGHLTDRRDIQEIAGLEGIGALPFARVIFVEAHELIAVVFPGGAGVFPDAEAHVPGAKLADELSF